MTDDMDLTEMSLADLFREGQQVGSKYATTEDDINHKMIEAEIAAIAAEIAAIGAELDAFEE